ncbi:MAG: HAD family phosphatase [Lachnospiraceae bacterium]|nr:HAD family phosphatase [Lachnospiraceae bacterium]
MFINDREISCAIFDMDGVIFDSERANFECWTRNAKEFGFPDIEKVYFSCVGTNKEQTDEILKCVYGRDFGEKAIADFRLANRQLFHELYDGGRLPVKKGVREILKYFYDNGLPVSIASSTRSDRVREELTEAGLLSYFRNIVGGEAVKVSKPNPEIYQIACREMGVQSAAAMAIEDSYNGIRAAHSAGMFTVMVPDLKAPDHEMEELSDLICVDLIELMGYSRIA